MSTVIVRRPQRQPAPEVPIGEVVLDPPPEAPRSTGVNMANMIMMLPMVAGAAGMGLLVSRTGTGGSLVLIAGGMYGVSIVGTMAVQLFTRSGSESKSQAMETRRRYLRDLGIKREKVRAAITQQREALHFYSPPPESLWSVVGSARLWERRPAQDDFCLVRIGVGDRDTATPVIPPRPAPAEDVEPVCGRAAHLFERAYRAVSDLPVTMRAQDFSRVYIGGDRHAVLGLVRALVGQLATFQSPDDLLIAWCVPERRRVDWEWTKWLPHALHPTKTDALGQLRLVASTVPALEAMLGDILAGRPRFGAGGGGTATAEPQVIVVLDGGDTLGSDLVMTEGGLAGITIADIAGPAPRVLDDSTVVLTIDRDATLRSRTIRQPNRRLGRVDQLSAIQTEALARQLAPRRLSSAPAAGAGATEPTVARSLTELLGLADPRAFTTAAGWGTRTSLDRLRIRFGVGVGGRGVELDLKESALGGMGPHGLLVGATGSGKSETLRTLVLGLAMTHSPEVLNFLLIDFKSGAAFNRFKRLPHEAGLITNLVDNLSLVDRMKDALYGELARRQEKLAPFGGDLREYERTRREGADLPPLPSLLVICDEFSELLREKPDFLAVFDRIARQGRSAGVHLLLSSQRIDGARLQTLESQLSFRLCLRTNSSAESRLVLGTDAAYQLDRPGSGYLKAGADAPELFQAAYVSGPVRHRRGPDGAHAGGPTAVSPYTTRYRDAPAGPPGADDGSTADGGEDDASGETTLDVVIDRLAGHGRKADQVWLDPLSEPPTLDYLVAPGSSQPLTFDPKRGLTTSVQAAWGALSAAVGIVDLPFERRQDPLSLSLPGSAGNVLVIGGPQAGKSTLLRTLIGSLALSHTPAEAQFYCLDFGGGTLGSLAGLPHVGGVARRRDVEVVRRTVAEITGLLHRREASFAAARIDGAAEYRRRVAAGSLPGDGYGDVFLVVDGWSLLRTEFAELLPDVGELASRGLGFGIHVVGSCARALDAGNLLDHFGTRLELRLGDPSLSAHRREALNVPAGHPGRGLTPAGAHFQAGLPRIDGRPTTDGLADAVESLVGAVSANRQGSVAPPVRLLPRRLRRGELPGPPPARREVVAVGVRESDLGPVVLDLAREPWLLIVGEGECGKSTLLSSLVDAVGERYGPGEADIIVVDHGRADLWAGAARRERVLRHCQRADGPQGTADVMAKVAVALRERLDGLGGDETDQAARRWADLFVLVDDYELVASAADNPLAPLVELVPHAADIGLRVVVARGIGGASLALTSDQLLRTIVQRGAPGVVMSGPRGEGRVLGRVPGELPPGRGWLVSRRLGAELVQFATAVGNGRRFDETGEDDGG